MSVHRSASSSGLLLQAVMTRVGKMSDNVNAAFLKDALAVIENVHKQFAGKLVSFLVNKYLIGPHLSLTRYKSYILNPTFDEIFSHFFILNFRQANFIACTRVEAMINTSKDDVLKLFTNEELASILETLKLHKLTKRFGRLSTLLNRVATGIMILFFTIYKYI